jgi:hypothetical protein
VESEKLKGNRRIQKNQIQNVLTVVELRSQLLSETGIDITEGGVQQIFEVWKVLFIF